MYFHIVKCSLYYVAYDFGPNNTSHLNCLLTQNELVTQTRRASCPSWWNLYWSSPSATRRRLSPPVRVSSLTGISRSGNISTACLSPVFCHWSPRRVFLSPVKPELACYCSKSGALWCFFERVLTFVLMQLRLAIFMHVGIYACLSGTVRACLCVVMCYPDAHTHTPTHIHIYSCRVMQLL